MLEFKISEWKDDDDDSNKQENITKDNGRLIILIGTLICEYNGDNWTYFPLVDQDKISDQIISLRCPALLEIPHKTDDVVNTLLLSGGFDSTKNQTSKQCFTINKYQSKKDEQYYSLNFGYSDMIIPRFLHKTLNIDNKYFLTIGGKNDNSWLDDCEVFNFESRKWINFEKMNSKRSNFDAIYINKKVFVFGGFESFEKFSSNSIEMCDFNLNDISVIKWKVINIKFPLLSSCKVTKANFDNKLMIIGGCDENSVKNHIYLFDVDKYDFKILSNLTVSRANFHYFKDDDSFICIGGSFIKLYGIENKVSNFIEKTNLSTMKSELINFDQIDFLNKIGYFIEENYFQIIKIENGLPYSTSIQI